MRYIPWALAVLAASCLVTPLLAEDGPPNFNGTWQLDTAKSQMEAQVTLTIQDDSGKINFTRISHDKDGREVTSHFTCKPGGSQCDFDEGGHKAKVTLWYNGTALVILKTDGPKEDAVTQWKLELSPDKHTLNVEFTHIDPNDKTANLVFDKKAT